MCLIVCARMRVIRMRMHMYAYTCMYVCTCVRPDTGGPLLNKQFILFIADSCSGVYSSQMYIRCNYQGECCGISV